MHEIRIHGRGGQGAVLAGGDSRHRPRARGQVRRRRAVVRLRAPRRAGRELPARRRRADPADDQHLSARLHPVHRSDGGARGQRVRRHERRRGAGADDGASRWPSSQISGAGRDASGCATPCRSRSRSSSARSPTRSCSAHSRGPPAWFRSTRCARRSSIPSFRDAGLQQNLAALERGYERDACAPSRAEGGGMKRRRYPFFDTSAIPDDLCPIATKPNPMLPGDWRSMRPVVDRAKCVKCAVCWLYCPVQCVVEKPRLVRHRLRDLQGLRHLRRRNARSAPSR